MELGVQALGEALHDGTLVGPPAVPESLRPVLFHVVEEIEGSPQRQSLVLPVRPPENSGISWDFYGFLRFQKT